MEAQSGQLGPWLTPSTSIWSSYGFCVTNRWAASAFLKICSSTAYSKPDVFNKGQSCNRFGIQVHRLLQIDMKDGWFQALSRKPQRLNTIQGPDQRFCESPNSMGSKGSLELLFEDIFMQDDTYRGMWERATDDILSKLLSTDTAGLSYVGQQPHKQKLSPSMEHLACYFPGNMALGVMQGAVTGSKAHQYLEHAANLTFTCWQMYNKTSTG